MAEDRVHDTATHETYARAGFGAAVRRGSRPAVVVVDLSRGFTEDAFPTGADLTEVVQATNTLIHSARAAAAPVLFTVISYSSAEAGRGGIRWLDKAPGMRGLTEGSAAVALDPRLLVRDEDPVLVKKGASAFFATALASMLTALERDTVLVCGATTSGCVRATAVDAVQSGFSVLVPRECVGDRAAGPHEANLFDIDAKYGDVITVDDACAYLAGVAANSD